ncbi:MAG: hypothetical protein R3C40_09705 [Parvularculaceae bacterium]
MAGRRIRRAQLSVRRRWREGAAQDLAAPFLGELPIYPDLRTACDDGARSPQL